MLNACPYVSEQWGERKDELRDSNSQFTPCIHDLRASRCTLKKNLISCKCRNEIAEKQTPHTDIGLVTRQVEFPALQGFYY